MLNQSYSRACRWGGGFFILLAAVEILLTFWGPWTFRRKPSVILLPLNTSYLEKTERTAFEKEIEKELNAQGRLKLYPRSFVESWYMNTQNQLDVFEEKNFSSKEIIELGKELEVERVVTGYIYAISGNIQISLNITDTATGIRISRWSDQVKDLESFQAGINTKGEALNYPEELASTTSGPTLANYLYLFWLAGELLLGVFLLGGRFPGGFLESLFIGGGLLHLFAFIYAQNGDMPYVQRFAATSGSLDIGDTSTERMVSALRFLPLQLLNLTGWGMGVYRQLREKGKAVTPRPWIQAPALAWALLGALLYALSLPNFLRLEGLALLAWVATIPLYLALRSVSLGRGILYAFAFTGLQILLINYWQGTFSYVSLPFTTILNLIIFAPFLLLLVITVRRGGRFWWLGAAALWTFFEWYRGLGFLGYPWGALGVSQYSVTPLIQMASWTGVWGLTFLTHLSGGVLTAGIEGQGLLPRGERQKGWLPAAFTAGLTGLLLIQGAAALKVLDRRIEAAPKVSIAAIQQNTDPRKHDYEQSLNELIRLSEEALRQGPLDLIAWPEGGFSPDIRFWLQPSMAKRSRRKLVDKLFQWQESQQTALVTGTQDHFFEEDENQEKIKKIQNSAVFLPSRRRSVEDRFYYYKIRLVPFTENFPYGETFPRIAKLLKNFASTQWTPGTEYRVFSGPGFNFATPLCFEDVFPNHVRRFTTRGAQVIVNLSNDYWAVTPQEGYQHAAHALFRAVENRRPLIRATSSGWTFIADAGGRIQPGGPPPYQAGWTRGEVALPDPETPLTLYQRWGDWFPLTMGGLWFLGFFFVWGRHLYRKKAGKKAPLPRSS